MTQADRIRRFVLDQCISPARAAGKREVTIRAGDIHGGLGLVNSMPAVCSAIGAAKFSDLAGVTLTGRTGPPRGANVYFTFELDRSVSPRHPSPSRREAAARSRSDRAPPNLDLAGALVLVSCVKRKLTHAAPARNLYTSAWFIKAKSLIEASDSNWYILSARYGLVHPDTVIAPYDETLNTLGVAERRTWAGTVLKRLLPETHRYRRLVMLAGQRYREFLVPQLRARGIDVVVPMGNLRLGEQLSWLSKAE